MKANRLKIYNMKFLEEIDKYLRQIEYIDFAIVFGSVARNKANQLSDLDIGIHVGQNIDLMARGKIIADIEEIVKRNVDLVILNELYKTKPEFTYYILKDHHLIFAKNKEKYLAFKNKALLYYMDHKEFLDSIKDNFNRRLEEGKFGQRNYASKAFAIRK
ncbi:type VII toxin-antitoxin system MntA family adenylyltransferase antitoxin [Calditrichota bacterium GD2]